MLDWNDLLRVVARLEATIAEVDAPVPVRLLRALYWLDVLESAKLQSITGPRLDELLELLQAAAAAEFPPEFDFTSILAPSGAGRMLFRLLAGQYTRIDSYTADQGSWRGRWRLFTAAVRLTAGRGKLPVLDPRLSPVPFDRLESSIGRLPPEADEILTRYLRVKISGMHFCGRAYYDVPLIPGFRSLALAYAATRWIARWLAASRGHSELTTDDVADALAMADHHHGYSPALGTFGARGRAATLQRLGDVPRLVAWYSR